MVARLPTAESRLPPRSVLLPLAEFSTGEPHPATRFRHPPQADAYRRKAAIKYCLRLDPPSAERLWAAALPNGVDFRAKANISTNSQFVVSLFVILDSKVHFW